jgi:hypothetical protein
MSVWIRIALYVATGWLYGSGYIGDEVKAILTTDPAVASGIEAGIAAIMGAVPVMWWRLAKKFGWST